jgi:hypothetical protein
MPNNGIVRTIIESLVVRIQVYKVLEPNCDHLN